MTTYHTIDYSLPAPSDHELVDTREKYKDAVYCPEVLSLDTFCDRAGITLDRPGWFEFVAEHVGNAGRGLRTEEAWRWWYRAFTSAADARDERETEQDALR